MMRTFFARFLDVFRRHRRETALDEEVRAHLELLAVDFERRGMTPDDAHFAARRAFGGVEQMKERHRERRGLSWLDDVGRDVRCAARSLRRSPGIRMAIRARPADVLANVMREAMAVVGAGVMIGLPVALASARALEAMVFELSPYDPTSVAIAAALILGVAAAAAFGPARRASRVDPSIALRAE